MHSPCMDDFTSVAKNLVNLEKVSFVEATLNDILPFVSHSRKLKEIDVKFQFKDTTTEEKGRFSHDAIDMPMLNEERRKLASSHRLTIFICESVYLRTKWSMRDTILELVRLKRKRI